MRARVNVYQKRKETDRDYPRSLMNMRQYYLGHMTTVMRMFGIGHITMRPVQMGMRVTPQISFRPMPISPTDETMLAARPDVVRRLAEDMQLMGILEVELSPEEGDETVLKNSWEMLATATTPGGMPAEASPKAADVPLNIEADPTAQEVPTVDVAQPAPAPAPAPAAAPAPVPAPAAAPAPVALDGEKDAQAEPPAEANNGGAIEVPLPPQ